MATKGVAPASRASAQVSGAAVAPIRKAVEDGPPGDPRVISIEPETHVDILKQFYLLPILEAKEEDSGKGFKVRVLEVASVTANEDEQAPGEPAAAPAAVRPALRSVQSAPPFAGSVVRAPIRVAGLGPCCVQPW